MDKMIFSPAEIEAESMRIIEEGLRERGFFSDHDPSGPELAIIKRVIHTTADFEFAETLRFTDAFSDSVSDLFKACKDKAGVSPCHIISDTNMILAGLSRPAMSRLQTEAVCYMGDAEIAKEAKERGVTRAIVSIEHAVSLYPEGIYLIGNAPTALIRLSELIREGKASPKLVAGVPVGFVNVLESKETALSVCLEYSVPAVLSMGRKGGSTVAVAVMNAIMYGFLR
ncbi:MAG: precorrin-8X methylmutase [Lachnospiraceae bacterium]|nr:precorrin-8X methylmutase [Lachnospiraceae bacterium]